MRLVLLPVVLPVALLLALPPVSRLLIPFLYRHGRRRKVHLEEAPVERRAAIIQAWYSRTYVSTRRHLGVDPKAPIEEFERIAPEHPVFRIVFVDESKPEEVRP